MSATVATNTVCVQCALPIAFDTTTPTDVPAAAQPSITKRGSRQGPPNNASMAKRVAQLLASTAATKNTEKVKRKETCQKVIRRKGKA